MDAVLVEVEVILADSKLVLDMSQPIASQRRSAANAANSQLRMAASGLTLVANCRLKRA
jgi:hypothetical protein